MSDSIAKDHPPEPDPAPEAATSRRQFLGRTAAAAVVAAGVPAVLAACGDSGSPLAPASAAGSTSTLDPRTGLRLSSTGEMKPWWVVHNQLAATVGAASDVTVDALAEDNGRYLQRIVTRDDRVGTGLATILRREYEWSDGRLTVVVEDGRGRAWPARKVEAQEDLVYAMKDALASNPLSDGVLKESLEPGRPVVAVIKPEVVQFWASAQSDYYGNFLQVASRGFSDLFNTIVGGIPLASTTRDLKHS
jgi:hypothetical protein